MGEALRPGAVPAQPCSFAECARSMRLSRTMPRLRWSAGAGSVIDGAFAAGRRGIRRGAFS